MKTAIVTVCIGDRYEAIAKLTHPAIKEYANRVGADFVVINNSSETPHWEKLKLYDYLAKYNRIIYVDTDLVIRGDCPNLFDIVPESSIGLFNEGRFSNRVESLREASNEYGWSIPPKWDGSYYNTGVMVVSRRHRQLFKTPSKVVNMGMWEQPYINLRIILDELVVEELDYKFNRMTLMDNIVGIHRCDSYIIHYAGIPESVNINRIINLDLNRWKEGSPNYRYDRNITIRITGGMGDQIASEPVVRYIIRNTYKDENTNYTVVSNWPRYFTHLEVPCMLPEEYERREIFDTPIKIIKTIPSDEESLIWRVWSHVLAHTVDYAAVCAISKTIPDNCKDINLKTSLEGVAEILNIMERINEDMILVHPGRGWDSKTFPKKWWDDIIEGLVNSGNRVGVIGKQISEDQGYVDVNIIDGVVDFRDLLTDDGLIALIALSKVVISNDSAPIHIAGAFDNYIILIATCKHPDHVLPWRKGSKYYKAYAFAKKLTVEDWDLSPTKIFKETADKIRGDILDYLPNSEEVVAKVLQIVES